VNVRTCSKAIDSANEIERGNAVGYLLGKPRHARRILGSSETAIRRGSELPNTLRRRGPVGRKADAKGCPCRASWNSKSIRGNGIQKSRASGDLNASRKDPHPVPFAINSEGPPPHPALCACIPFPNFGNFLAGRVLPDKFFARKNSGPMPKVAASPRPSRLILRRHRKH